MFAKTLNDIEKKFKYFFRNSINLIIVQVLYLHKEMRCIFKSKTFTSAHNAQIITFLYSFDFSVISVRLPFLCRTNKRFH